MSAWRVERTLLGALPSAASGHRRRRDPHRRPPAHGPLPLRAIQRARLGHRRAGRAPRRGSRARHRATGAPRSPAIASWDPASSPSTTPTMAVRRGGRPGPCDHGRPPSWPSSTSARWPRRSCARLPRRARRSCPPSWRAIVELERAHGREALVAALERALAHRRFRAADIRAILAAGAGRQPATGGRSDLEPDCQRCRCGPSRPMPSREPR